MNAYEWLIVFAFLLAGPWLTLCVKSSWLDVSVTREEVWSALNVLWAVVWRSFVLLVAVGMTAIGIMIAWEALHSDTPFRTGAAHQQESGR